MTYTIDFRPKALKSLSRLDKTAQKRIQDFLDKKIVPAKNPRLLGKPLQGPLKNLWRYRVGDYRIICKIEDQALVVLVVAVGHRKDVYDT